MRLSLRTFLFCLLAFISARATAQQQSAYGFLTLNGQTTQQSAVISWETIQELTITRFSVQQSRNGFEFETVGSIDANHDTTQDRHSYRFTDPNAGFRGKLLYYRLEIAVNNGRSLYSKTVLVRFAESGEAQLTIQPNVLRSSLPLVVESGSDAAAELTIVDFQGRVVRRQALQLVKGILTQTVDISGLQPGSFVAIVSAPGLKLQQRFFHQ
ncbi:hypothetical protein [Flaviaesturariibacter terrae]